MTFLHFPLAFLAGAAEVLASAPFGPGWLAPLPVALLFALWRQSPPRRAFLLGWAFGAGLMGFGIFWVHHSIATFGGMNPPLAVTITLLFALSLALFYGLAGWLANRFFPPGGARLLLAYPALWVLLEWVRSWLFTGFTWLSLGYSQPDTLLAGYAPLVGVYGLSLLVALTASLLLYWRSPWLLLVPVIWGGGWLLQQHSWSRPEGEPLEVALVQPNVAQALKWRPEQFEPILRKLADLTAQASGAKLVIWPETAVPAFSSQVEHSVLAPLQRKFSREKRTLLLGIPVDADGGYYNAMVSLGAWGRGEYRKRHLVPFGEYMPLRPLLEPLARLLAIPMSDFAAGDGGKPLLTLAGLPAGLSICYEDTFGREAAEALPEAAFLVNASNDAWFGDSLAPHQHLEMARMRALETGRWMLRATNTGISALIDDKGRVRESLAQFRQGVVMGRVQPLAGATPYSRWTDWPVVLLSLAMLAAALSRRGMGGAPTRP